jgi:hypothetical protein
VNSKTKGDAEGYTGYTSSVKTKKKIWLNVSPSSKKLKLALLASSSAPIQAVPGLTAPVGRM